MSADFVYQPTLKHVSGTWFSNLGWPLVCPTRPCLKNSLPGVVIQKTTLPTAYKLDHQPQLDSVFCGLDVGATWPTHVSNCDLRWWLRRMRLNETVKQRLLNLLWPAEGPSDNVTTPTTATTPETWQQAPEPGAGPSKAHASVHLRRTRALAHLRRTQGASWALLGCRPGVYGA